jgi:hypothetical protein
VHTLANRQIGLCKPERDVWPPAIDRRLSQGGAGEKER